MAYYALVMAGGVGTRLWPLSRRDRPKQSLKLFEERTMFEHAVDRIAPLFQPIFRSFSGVRNFRYRRQTIPRSTR